MPRSPAVRLRWLSRLSLLALPLLAAVSARAPVEPSLLAGLKWRNIGPFRAGRVSAVTGAIGQPGVYYMGLPIGGVWKTTSAGVTWFPVFDAIKDVSSVGVGRGGTVDPRIYVGVRPDHRRRINEGNGVYKSTDAGKTWRHLGID